jgi:hypothetical protein
MIKRIFIFFAVIINVTFLSSQENQIIKSLRDKIVVNINAVNSLRDKLCTPDFDATDDLADLKKNNLEKVFFYNDKKIMYEELKVDEDININITVIHLNFVNLLAISQQKIYVSDFILNKGKVYYFVGCKNENRSILLLFSLENDVDLFDGYSIINSRGELFFSKKPDNKKILTIVTKINDAKTPSSYFTQNKITKFRFLPNHEIYYFIEFYTQNY